MILNCARILVLGFLFMKEHSMVVWGSESYKELFGYGLYVYKR